MGSRTCIGKNISLMEMAKVIPQIIRNFELELVNPKEEWTTRNRWFVKQTNFFVNVSQRK
jgi:cytochrome P450